MADLYCTVCLELYREPVLLSCGHSFCKACLQEFWLGSTQQECPVCRRRSSREDPPPNRALQDVCESLQRLVPAQEAVGLCGQHSERLQLYCHQDRQPVCVICQSSRKHKSHEFSPVEEVVQDKKDELMTAIKHLQEKLRNLKKFKETCERTASHIKIQAVDTRRLIKETFEALHQFLHDEEMARLAILNKEEEEKSRKMGERIEKITSQITFLHETLHVIKEEMQADPVSFLQHFEDTLAKTQFPVLEVERESNSMVDVAKHLGSLKYRVWEKMHETVEYTPVTLDPNTANTSLMLSEDLTSLHFRDSEKSNRPDNLERFCEFRAVLGLESFNTGTHFWDVEVGDNTNYALGVVRESVARKGKFVPSAENGFWIMILADGRYFTSTENSITVLQLPSKIRVWLNWDGGELSFSNLADGAPLYTFKTIFTDKVLPIFCTVCNLHPLRLMPAKVSIQQGYKK